jgi:hypothetical protein
VFPACRREVDPASHRPGRHHLRPIVVRRAVRAAVRASGAATRATCHTCRHSVATRLLAARYGLRTVQARLGHADVRTPMIDTHVLDRGGGGGRSPAARRCAGEALDGNGAGADAVLRTAAETVPGVLDGRGVRRQRSSAAFRRPVHVSAEHLRSSARGSPPAVAREPAPVCGGANSYAA